VDSLPRPRSGPTPPAPSGSPSTKGLVELVRLIMVGLFALAGWELADKLWREGSRGLVLGILVGAGVGYVVGGAFGRGTARAVSEVERELGKVSAADVLAAAIGLTLALAVSVLASLPLFHLPPAAAYPTIAFIYLTMGYLGIWIGRSKSEELFGLFGVKPRAAGTSAGDVAALDSSAILDGRLLSLVRLGYLRGTLLVAREVLDELQAVADSSDPVLRTRGRRAQDLLLTLKREPTVDVVLVEEPSVPNEPVDARLVRLARHRGAVLVTNDAPLAKLASVLEVPVRSIHALAEALRLQLVPGESLSLRINRPGRERGQGIGYTEDGTMVVVVGADRLMGDTVPVSVTNVIQTPTGQLAFARLIHPETP
jgi:uncharacterized protein YacL